MKLDKRGYLVMIVEFPYTFKLQELVTLIQKRGK